MSNSAKLKKRAADYEARKQYDKALEVYEQVLNTSRAADEERDVPLYNRVGDLHYRLGNSEQAIHYYEQAADLYAEGGFFNNAIALCNKILRYSPGRTIVYYKLGIISAKKGFNSDAKQNFLEYADRMQRLGKMDQAFGALKEFADLCPGQDDIRLMLAEQLARADRKPEALEQLEILYDVLESEGRSSEAAATLERMNSLDPAFKPRRSITPVARKKEGLVFLDLDLNVVAEPAGHEVQPSPHRKTPPGAMPVEVPADVDDGSQSAPEGLELTSLSDDSAEAAGPVTIDPGEESESTDQSSPGLVFLTPAYEDAAPAHDIDPLDLDALDATAHAGNSDPAPDALPQFETSELELTGPETDSSWNQPGSQEEFIDLGEWLEQNRTPASTRMVAHDEEPEDNAQKDFAEMLDKFKAGISRNVDEEDFESHYDLGIAFREMGLLDEAIGSFQKAARGPDQLVRASEAIGQCFMDKGEAGVTVTVLERLVRTHGLPDSQLVGVLYLLGRAAESLSRESEAAGYYQRVLAVQIGFRDAATRLSSLAQASR